MKKLSKEEFEDRTQAVLRAQEIFMPHITNNISIAFEIYQKVLAEEERKLSLSKERKKHYNIMSHYKRPDCPKCGKELGLRIINIPQGKKNVHGYNTAWECECSYEEYSTNTLDDWLKVLPVKGD